jgi:hypothetical protein
MAAADKPHQRIVKELAAAYLKPMGLHANTSGRLWTDDRRYWYIMAEFQPSGLARGSYLNVGCDWLFDSRDYRAFTFGHREAEFVEYHSDDQFRAALEPLARRAADRVAEYRLMMADPVQASAVLTDGDTASAQSLWAAACLACLARDTARALALLTDMLAHDHPHFSAYHDSAATLRDAIAAGCEHPWLEERVTLARHLLRFSPISSALAPG